MMRLMGTGAESRKFGAVLRSCSEGLVAVRPLEDAKALEAASPRWLGGRAFDDDAVRAREGAMANRLASAQEQLVIVLLGGEHDLGEALAKPTPKAKYVRLTTHACRDAAGGNSRP